MLLADLQTRGKPRCATTVALIVMQLIVAGEIANGATAEVLLWRPRDSPAFIESKAGDVGSGKQPARPPPDPAAAANKKFDTRSGSI